MSIKPRFDPDTHYAITERHPAADTSHITRKYLDIPYANLSPAQGWTSTCRSEGMNPIQSSSRFTGEHLWQVINPMISYCPCLKD